MSRRMLLEDDYSNGLMPVTDGLICWLDGRDGKNGDTMWKDRSGNGNDAEITGCEWTGFSLKINNNSDQFLVAKTLIYGYKPYTLEVYFKRNHTSGGAENVIMANNLKQWHNGTSIYIAVNELFCDIGHKTLTDKFKNNKPYQVVITKSDSANRKAFLDGKLIMGMNGVVIQGISFLGNWDYNKMKGEHYSIRLYNRVLTEEEIQQNYLYEQSIERGE